MGLRAKGKKPKESMFTFGLGIRGQQGDFMILMRIVELVQVFVLVECVPRRNNKENNERRLGLIV